MSLWSSPGDSHASLGGARKGAAHLEAVERLEAWTRARFGLGARDTVMVSQLARALPGWPEAQTVVGFWTPDGTRHHFRVFKASADIVEDDLPPAWMKEALAASAGLDCECC